MNCPQHPDLEMVMTPFDDMACLACSLDVDFAEMESECLTHHQPVARCSGCALEEILTFGTLKEYN